MRKAYQDVADRARWDGSRILINGKTVYGGLGNKAGLHDFTSTAIGNKWIAGGKRLMKRLETVEIGDIIEVQYFENKTRDIGRWYTKMKFTHGKVVKKWVASNW